MKRFGFLLLVCVLVVLFRKFFLPSTLVWGDAPYFYSDGLGELVSLPDIWTTRGNSLGGVNSFVWIYPLMALYGAIGTFLNANNDLILRLLFYFPSLVFGLAGVYVLTKELKFSWIVTFFATLVYLINTYYLLLVDGGQVGVVLAYGIFPVTLFFLVRLSNKLSTKNFLLALITSLGLTVVDFRISAICLLTAFILQLRFLGRLKILLLLGACLVGLSFYWIIPATKLSLDSLSTDIVTLQTTSILNSLLLFSPNWPANEFGKTSAPYIYFLIVPVLVFLPLFIVKRKKIVWLTFSFLVFAFLAKGTTPPLGQLYEALISTRFGSIFRDSTKFFVPLVLFGGILIGVAIEELTKRIRVKSYIQYLFYFTLLSGLVWQAFFGQLNGVLGNESDISDYRKISQVISQDSGFLRSAWFNEKSPFAYHTKEKQALDAKDLVNFRPFAYMNAGTGDHFNFVNNSTYLEWFNLLGIKYLVLNGNPRTSSLNESDLQDWNRLSNLIAEDSRLRKVNVETDIPLYENLDIKPNKFFVDKTLLVIGGDSVYEKLRELDKSFSVANQGIVFVEDGKTDLLPMQKIASTSAVIIFNDKSDEDLKMSFLQKYFVAPKSAYKSQWAVFSGKEYLEYKYQLLIRNVIIDDFDYGFGIAFSTNKGEKISFKLDIPTAGDYVLAIRKMDLVTANMRWIYENKKLEAGTFEYSYENKDGFEIINLVAAVPVSEMKIAEGLSQNFLGTFTNFDLNNPSDWTGIKGILEGGTWEDLTNNEVTRPGWIIYTDSYNPRWFLNKRNGKMAGLPMYSMINGFYIDPVWGDTTINFEGEEDLRWGVYFSALSFLLIGIFVVWRITKDER